MCPIASDEHSLESATYKKSLFFNIATSPSQVGTWVTSSFVLPSQILTATGTAPSEATVRM